MTAIIAITSLAVVFIAAVLLTRFTVNQDRDGYMMFATFLSPLVIETLFGVVAWYIPVCGLVVVGLGIMIGDMHRSFNMVYPNRIARVAVFCAAAAVALAAIVKFVLFLT